MMEMEEEGTLAEMKLLVLKLFVVVVVVVGGCLTFTLVLQRAQKVLVL